MKVISLALLASVSSASTLKQAFATGLDGTEDFGATIHTENSKVSYVQ